VVAQLVTKGKIEDIADIFDLGKEDLVDLDRMASKSAENLLDAIKSAKDNATLSRLIYGLGMRQVGEATADVLAARFGSIDNLMQASRKDLASLEDFGEKSAAMLEDWLRNDKNKKLVERLKKKGIDPRAETSGNRLEGKTIVITGSLGSMTRDEAKKVIRRQGGKATGSVSGETDYLVVGYNPGAQKTEDAEEHGVMTIDEKAFLKLLGN